eukprot:scaffold6420_cov168-Amphora_coffeaeformis.AAC.13
MSRSYRGTTEMDSLGRGRILEGILFETSRIPAPSPPPPPPPCPRNTSRRIFILQECAAPIAPSANSLLQFDLIIAESANGVSQLLIIIVTLSQLVLVNVTDAAFGGYYSRKHLGWGGVGASCVAWIARSSFCVVAGVHAERPSGFVKENTV